MNNQKSIMTTTVIHHSADYDGIFCREIARKFMPEAEFIGWDFSDRPLMAIHPGFNQKIYILDLPVDKPFGLKSDQLPDWVFESVVWIDHHKSSIESHPKNIPGYRIDGVGACRLAWQWFSCEADDLQHHANLMPPKQDFVGRSVSEPLAVRLAGEYDVWDHRGDGDVEFQFGLDSVNPTPEGWDALLNIDFSGEFVNRIIHDGRAAMVCYTKRDADIMRERSFIVEFEGLKFLALTTARCNSNTFSAKDIPETGHDALMAFYFNGRTWVVSLYHAKHNTGIDLSKIAVKYGGGGHRGACGFQVEKLPFIK